MKQAFQMGVEHSLDKLINVFSKGRLGTTLGDKLFKGRKGPEITSIGTQIGEVGLEATKKELGKLGATHIIFDALHEGLEEVLQDLSDYGIDRIFANWTNDNFQMLYSKNGPTAITAEGLATTFVTAMFTSLVGSHASLLLQGRVEFDKDLVNREGQIVYDKEGMR